MHPWRHGFTFWNTLGGIYLLIFGCYWTYNLAHLVFDLKAASDIWQFTTNKLGLSERQLQTVTWPEVASRIVHVCFNHQASKKNPHSIQAPYNGSLAGQR